MAEVEVAGMRAFSFDPPDPPPWPGVVVLHEASGLNRDVRRIGARLARMGYATVVPGLYTGGPRLRCIVRTAHEMLRAPEERGTTDRIEQVRAWLADRPEVDDTRIGVLGFCMGGGFAVVAAARSPFAAAAVNYGRVPQDTSLLAGSCPVLANYGEDDRIVPRGTAERYEAALTAQGVPIDLEVFPGVAHSFMNHEPRVLAPLGIRYDEPAAERAWQRIGGFFEQHLGAREQP